MRVTNRGHVFCNCMLCFEVMVKTVTDIEYSLKLRVAFDNLHNSIAISCKLNQFFYAKIGNRMEGKT